MYEKPSQRRSDADAFSAERFVSSRMKMLVCRESWGDLRITRIVINKMMAMDSIHV